ncbi:hypothetical protein SAMN02746064_01462 [Alkalibacter saccharofermentans DSM 14828]|uniref:Uncharacterized protein n=1 Tax=Alkalibacter saccharofermentans DSM 14828 TaxID=1120975 RepID=A0A1M4XCC6_9FIRM|nr:hypothetical protein SAMN02746064_01462 [Alkalibacter saccharofermentans DSM 14828]
MIAGKKKQTTLSSLFFRHVVGNIERGFYIALSFLARLLFFLAAEFL